MVSYVTVMFFMLSVFLTVQPCSIITYLFHPFQVVQDTYIQEDNQSWWCSAQLQTDVYKSTFISVAKPLLLGLWWCQGMFYVFVTALDHETPIVYEELAQITLEMRLLGYLQICIANILYGLQAVWIATTTTVSLVSDCVPVQEDGLLLGVWSYSEWNSTEAWLQHANRTSVITAESVGSWFVAVNTCCFVGCIIMVVLIWIDYDPDEDEEPPDAETVNIDTD